MNSGDKFALALAAAELLFFGWAFGPFLLRGKFRKK